MSIATNKQLKIITHAVFVGFFVLLLLQFRLVGVQHDDYGYYSLNYGAETLHLGTKYSFAELFRFLGEHYYGGNGRLLYFALWLSLYKIGGLFGVQLAAALIVTIIWYLLWKIGSYTIKENSYFTLYGAVILCLCYGSMSVFLHRHGTYWFAAFFIYYTPIIAMEIFVILYEKFCRELTWKRTGILLLLIFASAWSGETWSVGTVMLMGALTIIDTWKHKKLDIKHILLVVVSIMGLLILLCAPGIHKRAGDSQWGFVGIGFLLERMQAAFAVFFSAFNIYYFLFFLTGCIILCIILYLKRRNVLDLLCAVGIAICEVVVYIDCTLVHPWMILILFCMLFPLCRYYYYKGDSRRNMLFFAALMSVASLVAVPSVGERIFIPFEICSFLIIFDICNELYEGIFKGKLELKNKFVKVTAILVSVCYVLGMTGVAVKNYKNIYDGYYANAQINAYNDAVFAKAKEQIEEGEDVTSIYLKRYADDLYATTTLYQDDWFKEYLDWYYEMPSEIEYIYE